MNAYKDSSESGPHSYSFSEWLVVLSPLLSLLLLLFIAFILEFGFEGSVGGLDVTGYGIWAVTTFAVLFSSIVVLIWAKRKLAQVIDDTKGAYTNALKNLEADARAVLEASVVFRPTAHELRESLLDLKVFDEFAGQTEVTDLHLLGADVLPATEEEFGEIKIKKNRTSTEDVLYRYTLLRRQMLSDMSKTTCRYIFLFQTEEQLKIRTKDFRQEYLAWLKAQQALLRVPCNYLIMDTPRGPVWGSPKSTIILHDTMVYAFFKQGGIILKHPSVVTSTRKALVVDYIAARDASAPKFTLYDHGAAAKFEEYVTRIQKYVHNLG